MRKKRTGTISSIDGVSIGGFESSIATTTMATTSVSIGPSISIGQGGDQPPKNNVLLTRTCGGGPLPNIRKTGEKEDDKNKGKEQEKFVAKPSSPV